MKLEDIQIIKSDERGVIYNCGKSNFISRKKGTISANHSHDGIETLYLVKGEATLTVGDETQQVQAPIMVTIGSNIYHQLIALTDIEIVIDIDYTSHT